MVLVYVFGSLLFKANSISCHIAVSFSACNKELCIIIRPMRILSKDENIKTSYPSITTYFYHIQLFDSIFCFISLFN